ncbi:hypothetical protein [Dethiosulfatarculus sandiegensis]|nr:hypothetical protein [Dethiosulfatarculus sandiegensis]
MRSQLGIAIAVCCLAVFLLWKPVFAAEVQTLERYGPPFVEYPADSQRRFPVHDTSRILVREVFQGFDDVTRLSDTIILDESWEEWLRFQREARTSIPLLALKRLLVGAARYEYAGTYGEKFTNTIRIIENDPINLGFLLKSANPIDRKVDSVRTKRDAMEYEQSFNPFNWIMEGQGLLSGRPWNWANFIPRLLTIAGLIVFGLLLTEFLHLIYRLGVKMMGRNALRRR